MSEAPRPTVTPCPAQVRLADGTTLDATFWLLPDPGRASGVLPLDALLDESREFVAVGLPGGGSTLLRLEAIRTVSIGADAPGSPDAPDAAASLDVVTLHLDGGEKVSGVLQAVPRPGNARMSDLFNGPERILAIGAGDRVVLVQKARVVRVEF